ncbi:MAG TPA: GMC oxidoreductase, partial [Aliidongia sp.]|uniref:GMC oxidoreductase n=1 Tax=Aliidongia sp. TaxID=1914230 RepID=UPI002DDCDDB2
DAEFCLLHRVQSCENLKLLTDTVVTGLTGAPGNPEEVSGVVCADGATYSARIVVLAGGALNSPRMLQAYFDEANLTAQLPAALNIGRNYKCHLNSALIVFSAGPITDLLRKTTILFHDGFPHSSVQNLGWLDGELIAPELPRAAPHWVADFAGRHAYGFWITTEDGSHPENRLAPSGSDARYGVIDYDRDRLPPAETEHKRLIRTLEHQLLRSGYAGFVKRMPVDNTAHACGTLMAGSDPTFSVVDRNGKVHGMANLYVADGSVMPRSGRVNPALTIYAWGLRLSDHLQARLRRES